MLTNKPLNLRNELAVVKGSTGWVGVAYPRLLFIFLLFFWVEKQSSCSQEKHKNYTDRGLQVLARVARGTPPEIAASREYLTA